MSSRKYYYAFNGKVADGYDSFVIVAAGFWQKNKQKELDYTSDGSIAKRLEKLGFLETMQNTFEYANSRYDEEAIKVILGNIKNLVYNPEFQEYIVEFNIKAAIEKAEAEKKKKSKHLDDEVSSFKTTIFNTSKTDNEKKASSSQKFENKPVMNETKTDKPKTTHKRKRNRRNRNRKKV